MADVATSVANKPVWVDLASTDAAAARTFYSTVFGWDVEVNPDPQYGGYGRARIGGKDVAGIGGTVAPGQPSAWSIYLGTTDIDQLADRVTTAGGTVVAPPFDVGDQGRMAVFRDPSGAHISSWQASRMGGFDADGPNTFGWPELNARGLASALPFYTEAFGWEPMTSGSPEQPYTEFHLDGESIAGALEMSPMVPAEVPSYWMVYFSVRDVDATYRAALEAGAREMLSPMDFPGGRLAIVTDPQGAMFGVMTFGPA